MNVPQRVIAELLGINTGRYGMWEALRVEPHFEYLVKLSEFFGVSIDDFLKKELWHETNDISKNKAG